MDFQLFQEFSLENGEKINRRTHHLPTQIISEPASVPIKYLDHQALVGPLAKALCYKPSLNDLFTSILFLGVDPHILKNGISLGRPAN